MSYLANPHFVFFFIFFQTPADNNVSSVKNEAAPTPKAKEAEKKADEQKKEKQGGVSKKHLLLNLGMYFCLFAIELCLFISKHHTPLSEYQANVDVIYTF